MMDNKSKAEFHRMTNAYLQRLREESAQRHGPPIGGHMLSDTPRVYDIPQSRAAWDRYVSPAVEQRRDVTADEFDSYVQAMNS